jgi:glyoxylase-like metal-dependent hydrolase (beta-lactamase superfamily II)
VALKYYGRAHTDTTSRCIWVEFDILHTGDTFWNGIYRYIDYSTGAASTAAIRAADANLAMATDRTIVVPATASRSAIDAGSRTSGTCWWPSARMSPR